MTKIAFEYFFLFELKVYITNHLYILYVNKK